ncbi:AAA family ATPase [Luteibacter yeojuensis]|uniref:AAA family ATPase n=1 Tax=Luteibacter yeojuensis TaxID=345309 RepID=A0A7X5QRW4_9GAMM|nr:ATP-binding protein [Luteibacter yeojuensis]NID14244.1 AAA family ATPase [Luteibacter yeojuensis]
MLIEFSVANFRSFRERQTFQMTAAPRPGKRENVFSTNVPGDKLPDLLKVAAIYGGNASGKTNLIRALGIFSKLAAHRPEARARSLPVEPFRFDAALLNEPSVFEVHFIANGTRYQFNVSATRERIMHESLIAFPRGKEALLYVRARGEIADEYEFGGAFEGPAGIRDVWRGLTGPQSLFISQVVANSSEDLSQLRAPYAWLAQGAVVLDDGPKQLERIAEARTGEFWSGESADTWKEGISAYLQDIDVPVTSYRLEENETGRARIILTHQTRLGEADFELHEESSGTRNLIGFWLMWNLLIGSAGPSPERYGIIVVDELDASLHPEIVEHLVAKHISSGSKTQLIFTTHDTHLMSTRLLRRDQLWVADRNSDGATRLTSIHSYEGREGEDVEKRYFEGRYRGLPVRKRG